VEAGFSSVVSRVDVGSLEEGFSYEEQQILFIVSVLSFHLGKGVLKLIRQVCV